MFYFLFCEKYVIYTVFIDEGKENSHETEISFERENRISKNPKKFKNGDKLFYFIR